MGDCSLRVFPGPCSDMLLCAAQFPSVIRGAAVRRPAMVYCSARQFSPTVQHIPSGTTKTEKFTITWIDCIAAKNVAPKC